MTPEQKWKRKEKIRTIILSVVFGALLTLAFLEVQHICQHITITWV